MNASTTPPARLAAYLAQVPQQFRRGLDAVRRLPRGVQVALALIAVLAIALPVVLVNRAPPPARYRSRIVLPTRVVPKTEIPTVEPVQLQAVDPDDARAINASIPFSTEPNLPARAFKIFGEADSQARATDCLAAAVYYEAGDDAEGQRAVAQVVLNRTRHPAFPKTVCGVVFQGSERTTGCQFTFSCDGSMLRYSPSQAAWERARAVARLALNGSVDKVVGLATHYHTDWVVPYWSASLEKISAVHTHLFFRWTGWWGTPPAFTRAYTGEEPNVPLMAKLSPSHSGDPEALLAAGAAATAIDPESIPDSVVPKATGADDDSFLVTLPKGMNAESFASLAVRTCGERVRCKFMAWTESANTPNKLPLNSYQVATMSFSYLRDQNQGFAKALWNCALFPRPSPVQCMRAQPLADAQLPPRLADAPKPLADSEPSPLAGVRRKGDPAPSMPSVGLKELGGKLPTPAPSPRPTPVPAG
ncbi:cell wall hydrolase [Sphingomonas sp.]|uniref:cell wall hydrolase n=1 Tax=Sphingomonas sp. TaxID=28214 RepID=UPI001B1D3B2E|nr:cell wall hydrolase [Sphingomonas sp.]MBO9711953.1 cell wall hydrolase [Sphingomonas sp.]